MKSFPYTKLPGFDFQTVFMGDLIEHEGPLLSLFSDTNFADQYYLYKWADIDDVANRWLIIPLKRKNMLEFFLKKTSFLELIQSVHQIYFQDLNNELDPILQGSCATIDLPAGYLPSAKAYFNEDAFTPFAATCAELLKKPDGNTSLERTLTELQNQVKTLTNKQDQTLAVLEKLKNGGSRRVKSKLRVFNKHSKFTGYSGFEYAHGVKP